MADYEALQQAILRNRQATGQMAGLDEQYSRANALRDQAQPEVNKYGTVSPFAVIANTIDKSRGRKDARGLEKTRAKAREDIATGEAAIEGNTLRMALGKEARDITRAGEETTRAGEETTAASEATGTYEDDLLTAKQDRAIRLKEANKQGKGVDWTSPDGKRTVGGGVDSDGNPYIVVDQETGERVNPIDLGWQEENTSYGGYRHGKAMPENAKVVIASNAARIEEIRRVKDNWDSGFGQAYRQIPTGIVSGMAKALADNDILTYIDESQDPNVKAAAQWWADWQMFYTADKRHELFGSALTAPEIKSWNAMLNMRPGMDPDEIEKRMNTLSDAAERSFLRRANVGMIDPIQGNKDVWTRSVGDLLPYDAATNMFSAYGVDAEPESGGAPLPAGAVDANNVDMSPVTKEQGIAFGEIVLGMDEMQKARFQKQSPLMQRHILNQLFLQQMNEMQE